jgi:hypothetical protein
MSLSLTDVTPEVTAPNANMTIPAFGSNISGDFSATAIPEPASIALLGIGVSGLLAFSRFFQRRR